MYWAHKKVYDAKRSSFVKCNDVVLDCMIYTTVCAKQNVHTLGMHQTELVEWAETAIKGNKGGVTTGVVNHHFGSSRDDQ